MLTERNQVVRRERERRQEGRLDCGGPFGPARQHKTRLFEPVDFDRDGVGIHELGFPQGARRTSHFLPPWPGSPIEYVTMC
jgi:hypothetical protein